MSATASQSPAWTRTWPCPYRRSTCAVPLLSQNSNRRSFCRRFTSFSATSFNSDNTQVKELCREGRLEDAMASLKSILAADIPVDSDTYETLFQAFARSNNFELAKSLHRLLISLDRDSLFLPALLRAYCHCGSLLDARLVFDKIPISERRGTAVWNLMLSAYVRHGCFHDTLLLFHEMLCSSISPDSFSLSVALKASRALRNLHQGFILHSLAVRTGHATNEFVQTSLISMYCSCGRITDARNVFDKMSCRRSRVTWNSMISGSTQQGFYGDAMKLFAEMDCNPDSVTLLSVVPSCAALRAMRAGRSVHGYSLRHGFLSGNIPLHNAFIKMYGDLQCVEEAFRVFENMPLKDTISWNSMISAYAENGLQTEAFALFDEMEKEGLEADVYTLSSLLSYCSRPDQGRRLHDYVRRHRMETHTLIQNALLQMFANCRQIRRALAEFNKMRYRDEVSWNTMLCAYQSIGAWDEALKFFKLMQHQRAPVKPTAVTYLSLASVCANLGNILQAKQLHAPIIKSGFLGHKFMENSLIDMYSKCSSLGDAVCVFQSITRKDVASWTAMIQAYGMHGRGAEAVSLFEQMQKKTDSDAAKPNSVTFLALLCACGRAGMVEEGLRYFREMNSEVELKHYAAVVDMFGRGGMLQEAHKFIEKMPLEADAAVWGALLASCRRHRDITLAEYAAKRLFDLAPASYGHYVLLQNVYMDVGRWDAVAKVRAAMKRKGLLTEGCSWIELDDGSVHAFVGGDWSHPQAPEIYALVERWRQRMKEKDDESAFVLRSEFDAKSAEDVLCGHSEKLAIALGILKTQPRTSLRVVKNLQMCGKCHEAVGFISGLTGREMRVETPTQVHIFSGGYCSCSGRSTGPTSQ